ncbi:hypothetical protein Esti_002000 [Eimeria stiedai]
MWRCRGPGGVPLDQKLSVRFCMPLSSGRRSNLRLRAMCLGGPPSSRVQHYQGGPTPWLSLNSVSTLLQRRATTASAIAAAAASIHTQTKGRTRYRHHHQQQHGTLLRPHLRFFFLAVHPDLTQHFPDEARRLNADSLSQFNAYVDLLQQMLQQQQQQQQKQQQEDQQLSNRVPFQQQQQRQQQRKVRPVYIHLHSLPLEIHRSQVEAIVENLFLRLTAAVEGRLEATDTAPQAAPLLTPKHKERQALERLWEQQIDEVAFKDAIYQQNPKRLARIHAMRRCYYDYETKLREEALNTKNKKTRKRRLASVARRAQRIVYRQFGPDPKTPPPDAAELLRKTDIAERGFHPELVYVHPWLTQQQREEALDRICGRLPRSLSQSDRWLLASLLSTLRNNNPPIPLLVCKQYRHLTEAGMLEVPVKLEVWPFADLVERELDNATATRKKLLGCLSAAGEAGAKQNFG